MCHIIMCIPYAEWVNLYHNIFSLGENMMRSLFNVNHFLRFVTQETCDIMTFNSV